MQLRTGDRFTDERDWEVVSRPTGFSGGKTVRVLVRRVGEVGAVDQERVWSAHERVVVRRA